jgi:hypothetical protein
VTQPTIQFPKPTAWHDRLILWGAAWEACEGVPVAVGSFQNEAGLRAHVAAALRLLAVYAPADLARVHKLMRGIVVTRLHGSNAQWRQSLRICMLSTDILQHNAYGGEGAAAAIIHELMHARLDALGFDYRKERRARIERICFRASRRFLEKLPSSSSRTAALEEIEEFLTFDSGVWLAVTERDYRPWYVKVLARVLHQVTRPWHHEAPT